MKIRKVFLENFRSFYGTGNEIEFEDFTVLIGKNDQGKSSVLEALDIFLNEGKGIVKIDQNDLNIKAQKEGESEFRIGVVFDDYPEKLVIDSTNETSLKDEYLLNEKGYLEIWKRFKGIKLQEVYIRCYHPSNNDTLKQLLTKKTKELQNFVEEKNIPVSDKRKAAELRKAIRDYYEKIEGRLILSTIDITIESEGLKEIWEKLKRYIPVYALFHADRKNVDQDSEIQDPLRVKIEQIFNRSDVQEILNNIGKQINTEITNFAHSTVEQYKKLTNSNTEIIKPEIPDVSELKWKDVYKGIGYKTTNDVPLNKRGSGIRRIVLLSSFLADVENKSNENSIENIVYAIEEPETSLHPDLQIRLINALYELVNHSKCQVIITTHSPALIRHFETSQIRFLEQENGIVKVSLFSEPIMSKIINSMGILPSVGKVMICVEGKNDESFLLNLNQSIKELKEIIDLQENIRSNIIAIILMNGSNLKDWIDRYALKNTNAIEFHLYDRDDDNKYQKAIDSVKKRKDGSKAFLTRKREIENYVPKYLLEKGFGIKFQLKEDENWDEIDVPKRIKELCKDKIQESDIKARICGQISKQITKDDLENINAWDEVRNWFVTIKELVDKVI